MVLPGMKTLYIMPIVGVVGISFVFAPKGEYIMMRGIIRGKL